MIKVRITGDLKKEFDALTEKGKAAKMESLVNALAAATPIDTGEARQGWHIVGDSIVNNVEYIESLNSGSSQQAPSHFIEQTLLTQQGVSPSGTIVRSK